MRDTRIIILDVILNNLTPLNIFHLDANFNKWIIGLDFSLLLSILVNYKDEFRSINISSIKELKFKFMYLKLCIKDKFITLSNCKQYSIEMNFGRPVNNTWNK